MLEKLFVHTKIVAAFAAGLAVAGTGGAAATMTLASHHGSAAVRAAQASESDESAGPSASVSAQPSASESASPEPSESASPEPSESDSPEPSESPTSPAPSPSVSCPSPDANHGANVSAVARDKSLHGREHGAAVSQMAQSDCGKASGGDESDQPDPVDSDDQGSGSDQGDGGSADAQAGHGGGHGHGGQGHGHHGKGHGHHG